MLQIPQSHWSILINILMQKYFAGLTTTCIFHPTTIDLELKPSANQQIVVLQINLLNLNESFEDNIYNFSKRELLDNGNNVYYDHIIKKLIAAIEHAHCEGFLAFQDDIPKFLKAFDKACTYAIWRSMNNRFLFAYSKDQMKTEDYFKGGSLLKDQFNILVIETSSENSSIFYLKTNKFVGHSSQHPEELLLLSTFHALKHTFVPDTDLFPVNRIRNLQGREIIVGAFDYRPFVAVDFQRLPLYHDQAADNPSHLVHADGAELRVCHVFCELYNCSLKFDTSEKEEWGVVFNNYSGHGLIGMIMDGTIHMAFGAMYQIRSFYTAVDMTAYMGRSGVTCLVPAASSLTSWDLPLRPFKSMLWLTVFACFSLESFMLFVTRKLENALLDQPKSWWSCLKYGCVTTLKLFLNQSSNYLVQSNTARTFLIACYMFDIMLSSIYGGGLAAVLTLPIFGETADTVEKLVEFDLTWTGSSYAWLESINETEGDQRSIYKRLLNNFELNTMEVMRSKAKTSNMAFIVERMAYGHFGGGDFITAQSLQRLKLMLDDIYSQFTVGMVSRLWPHLERYNNLLLQWHSSGLDQFWEWKTTADYLNVNEQNQVEASRYNTFDKGPAKLNIQNFAGLIVVWIAGMLLSVVAFVMEIIWHKWWNIRKFEK